MLKKVIKFKTFRDNLMKKIKVLDVTFSFIYDEISGQTNKLFEKL